MTQHPRLTPFFLLFLLVLSGCDLLGGSDNADSEPPAFGVIVANGGNFSDQNGTLTFHDPVTRTTTHSPSLGGFVQGLAATESGLAVLLNTFGPGRIDVLDPGSLTTKAQYGDMASPRDALHHDEHLWVTTSAFGEPGSLLALDGNGAVQRSVQVGDVPEGVSIWEGSVVVANNGSLGAGTTLSVLALETGETVLPIETGCDGPRDVYAATSLVVVCTGKTVYSADFSRIIEETHGQIIFIDSDFEILSRINLAAQAGSTNGTEAAHLSQTTGELFVGLPSREEIVIVDVASRSITGTIDLSGHPTLIGLSGIAYDAGRDQLYVGRFPKSGAGAFPDYAAAGTVQVMNRDGEEQASFTAGASISAIILQ